MRTYRLLSLVVILAVLLGTVTPLGATPDAARDTQHAARATLAQANVAGSFEHLLGGSDWSNNDALTNMADANSDGIWKLTATLSTAGAYEYKIVEDGDWAKAYPAANVPFTVAANQEVRWYYDPSDHYVADNASKVIAAVVGSFPSKIGGADWAPDHLKTLLKGPEGAGTYTYRAASLPAGNYEYKVALNESWDLNYGAGGVPGGPNIALAVPDGGGDVLFTYDPVTHIISHQVLPPSGGLIQIDGTKDAAYGAAVASDPLADMSEPNLDLHNLYIVNDANNFYIGFDAYATSWGMTYGIYLDTDQTAGSGASTDPWGRNVAAVDGHRPEFALYVWHKDDGTLDGAQLATWDGSAWQYPTLSGKGGARGFSATNHFLEYSIPKTALANPTHIAVEVFTTGGDGHAQDTVPSDPNVNYAAPDWGSATTTLSNFVVYPKIELLVTFPGSYPEAAGLGGNWAPDNLNTKGTDGNNDQVYVFKTSAIPTGSYEFKAAVGGTWAENYGVGGVPGGPNYPFSVLAAGTEVRFYYDRRDNWIDNNQAAKIITLVGSLGEALGGANWAPDNLTTWMKDKDGDGWSTFTGFLPAGSYEYKIAVGESWSENYGAGGVPGGPNIAIVVPTPGQNVTFEFKYATKEIRDSINNPPVPGLDGNIWWDGLGHNSRDPFYRTPFGAVTKGTEVRLRFRTFENDVDSVSVRIADQFGGGARVLRMAKVSTIPAPGYAWGYDIWEAKYTAPQSLTVLLYSFTITDGATTAYYADDASEDGAWGQPSNDTPQHPYNIYVYDAAFKTPDWAKNAVIYQIFPDRFRNGDKTNDAKSSDWFYPAERGHAWPITPWNTIVPDPEPNDPVNNPWFMTYSSTFYGGDLKGVLDKLDYLQTLGVNTIYFNPIFLSPSNHRYDGDDYRTIEPRLGDLAAFQSLAAELHRRGMYLILDMVPNHTSSDSIYFDRFGRHPGLGACESVDSPYRSWYYFTAANPPGTGVCAGDTNYVAWFGVQTLPKINTTDSPAVRDFWMRSTDATAKYWLQQGADGYRVDVANEIAPSFFTEWRPILQATKPDVATYSETWNESDVRPMVLGDKFDSTMNYRFSVALLSFLRDTPFSDGDGNLNLTPLTPSQFERAMRAIQEDYPEPAWSTAMNLLDSHDTNRAVIKLDHDGIAGSGADRHPVDNFVDGRNRLKTVAILQFTLRGAPTIYYGDEVGLAGFGSDVSRDDPYNRQPYPWADEPGYAALPTWRQVDTALLAHYQKMGQIRGQYSFFRTGSWDTLLVDDQANALVYGRRDGTGVGITVVNRAKTAQTVSFHVDGYLPDGLAFTDALNGGNYTVANGMLSVPVNGLWGAVLVHEGAVTRPNAPTGLTATEGESSVALAWNSVPGADKYEVLRSYLSGSGYEKIAEATGTSYVDATAANGRLYFYVVRALQNGMASQNSSEVSAIPHWNITGLLLQSPHIIGYTLQAGAATRTIYARLYVAGQTVQPGALAGVMIQIGFGTGNTPGAWQTWQPMTFHQDYPETSVPLQGWEEWQGALMPDTVGTYSFLVRASATGGRDWIYAGFEPNTSSGGLLIVYASADATPPAAPTGLRLVGTTPASISLAWDANTDADLWGYELYRMPLSGAATKIATIPAGTTHYVDREVDTGTSYRYYLLAVDTSYNRSTKSNEVAATAESRMVTVTFNVTVPSETPSMDVIYLPGDQPELGPWTPDKLAMTKVDATHWTTTLQFLDGTALQYKYARGSWDMVEWWDQVHDLINRSLVIDWGATGTQTVDDTVPLWRDPLVVSVSPANGATNIAVTTTLSVAFSRSVIPEDLDAARFNLKAGDAMTVTGTVGWNETAKTAVFTPTVALAAGRTYTLTVGPSIRGDAGSSMQSAYRTSFTTALGIEPRRSYLPLILR